MKKLTILLVVLLVMSIILFEVIPGIISIYNTGINLKNQVSVTKSNIDVAFNKQYMLLDNIVQIVERYSKFEASTLEKVIAARYRKIGGNNSPSNSIVDDILIIQERYPELRTNDHFMDLTNNMIEMETDIQNYKMKYNECVTLYNNYILYFPNNLMLRGDKWNTMKLYEITDKKLLDTKDTKYNIKM